MRKVLLLCCYRAHNKGADVIGRYDIFVKTVLLILFEDLPAYSCVLDSLLPVLIVSLQFGRSMLEWRLRHICCWDVRVALSIYFAGIWDCHLNVGYYQV